jgi:predicted enzyme related to lactoylglutathione lyase
MSEKLTPLGAFCWEELQSLDLGKAVPFYKELIGWSSKDWPLPGGAVYTLLGPDEKTYVAGAQPHSRRETVDWSGWLCYINVSDVDGTAARTAELGGSVVFPPHDIPDVGRAAVLKDPEGVIFALICFLRPSKEPENHIGAFCWRELMTHDATRAAAFYTGLLGWTTETMSMGDFGDYTLFKADGHQVGGMMAITPEMGPAPAMWTPYVSVTDVDALAARAGQLGGRLCVPPMDVPGVGRFCTVTDPAGAALALITLLQA